jgi:hypothetical protein
MADEIKSESAKKNEDWMNSKWRPAMGWMYMLVCTADFVAFPILWSLVQVLGDGKVETQWSPITLQGAGLFHMAMGAILGIAAYGRTQEKLGDKAGATLSVPPSSPNPAPSSFGGTSGFNSTPTPVQSSFGSGFNSTPAASAPTAPAPSKFGKVVPQADQPEL